MRTTISHFLRDKKVELLFNDSSLVVNNDNGITQYNFSLNSFKNYCFSILINKHNIIIETSLNSSYSPYLYITSDSIFISEKISYISDRFKLNINEKLIPEFICYGSVLPPDTMIEKLKIIPFNCCTEIFINKENRIECKYNYYKYEHLNIKTYDEDALMQTKSKLIDALKNIDFSNCIFLLSGGMDSTVLYSLIKEQFYEFDRTWSISYPFFDNRGDIEKDYAMTAADKVLIKDHQHIATNKIEYFKSLIQTTNIIEEPNCFNQTPLFNILFNNIYQFPENLNKNVINGMGADCVLGTKFHRKLYKLKDLSYFIPKIKFDHSTNIKSIITRIISKIFPDYYDYTRYNTNIFDYYNILWDFNNRRDYKFTDERFNQLDRHRTRLDVINRIDAGINLLDKFTYLDIYAEMTHSQRHWSKLSCNYGGGIGIFPFLNKDFVQHLFNYSWDIKLSEHKTFLLHIGRGLGLDDKILLRSKTGMSVDPFYNYQLYTTFISLIRDNIENNFDDIYDFSTSLKTKLALTNLLIWKYLIIDKQDINFLYNLIEEQFLK